MNNEWIRYQNISKSFPQGFWGRPGSVVDQVSFSVAKDRVTGFVGANGSGKTTLLKLGLGFIFPSGGEVLYPASDNDFTKFRRTLGYLPERPYYYEFLTALEFLKLHEKLAGVPQSPAQFVEKAEAVLTRVKLIQEKNRPLKTFSKGMLQRIGLAQALLNEPKFLILDEPMSGLDPDGRFEIRELLWQEKQKGTSLFFSSHLIEDVEFLCDDIILIAKGKIHYAGPLEQLKSQMQQSSLIEIITQLKVGGRL